MKAPFAIARAAKNAILGTKNWTNEHAANQWSAACSLFEWSEVRGVAPSSAPGA
ncbi:MAG: hypothetical protein ACAI43_02270 [Phycisphaerae bacterium]|nr:hypothetical protein [Tepidisphaeraceae bacterium]